MAWLLTLAMLLTVFSPLSAMADDFDPECQYPEDMPSTDDVVFSDPDDDPGAPCVVSAQDGTLSIAQIREKFPDGKYWNHAGNPGASNSVNNQDGWTNTPCPRHKTVGTSAQTCNGFAPSGTQLSWQCMGYAEKIGYDITGYNPRNNAHGWSTSKNVSALDSLKPGDIVRYKNDGHSIYVLGVDGDTVTYTDCNSDGHCKIRWDVTISKSTLASSFTYVRSAPFAISGGTNNLPVLCVDVLQGWQNHIYVKGWAFDPDNTSAKLAVHVYINGEGHEIIANKYHDQGLDDTFHCGTDHGFDQDILTEETGEVTVTIYAIDSQDVNQHSEPFDNSTYKNPTKVTITSDKTGPTISNAKITNVDSTGYTVTCTVTDASGVNRVQFPTWTKKNDQDDLLSDWGINPKVSGTRNGNTFTFRVKTSDHNNESGVYYTHIYAYDNSYRGNCSGPVALNVTVPAPTVAVTGVSLNKTSLSFTGTGSSQTLTATVSPSNATNKTLTWSSSNTSVATVSNGVVKAVGFGTATITAKSNNGKTASCKVTVNPIAVTGVILNKSSLNFIGTGSSQTLTATVSPSNATNKTLTWSSSNTSVATVSNGVVKAVGFGTATITAKSNNGKTAAVKVTVEQVALSSIAVATMPNKTYYYAGETLNTAGLTLKATYNNGSTKTITEGFTCSPTKLNTVNHNQPITVSYGGKTTAFTVNVNEFYVKSIEIASAPTKTAYFVGDTLDTTGLKIKVFYNSGASKVFDTGFTCTPTTLNTAGTQTITVSYKDATISVPKTATFDVTVQNVTLSGIAVASKPSKVNYFVGDTLDTTGLKLTATYNNGTTQTITGGFTCTPTALSTAGAQTVTVSYGGKTATFTVNVQDVTLSGIAIASNPTKTSYYVGDTLDTTGLKLTATYNNGTTQTITGGFTCTPTALSTAGAQTVTVNYGGKTATFTVNVQDVTLSGIAIASNPTKISYYVGDTLDTTGLKLTATYNNGTTQTITGGFTCTPTALSTAGVQTITVNYGGKTATFAVNVQDVTLSGIAIASNPTKTSYYVGDTLDTTGLKLTATYNNGTTQTITGGFTCTPTALSTAGVQTVTVNYGGKTATFTVSVELPVLPFVTLTFDPTDGVLDLADTPEKTVYPGEAYGRLPEPTADGMVFLGWYTESGKRITSLTTCDLTGDATVSARWALASAEGWSFDEATGTLTLDGSGAMKEYTSAAEAPWYSYRDSIAHLVVKSGVTSLSSYAFVGCQNLADITLPDTLQTIGTMTFYGCDSLNNVTIPASVRTIGSYAFADALSLSRITFAGDAPEFGTGVFTFRKLTAYYPVYASGWETVVDGRYDFGGSITWVRSSESLAAEEPVLLSAAEPDDVLALDWTL